MLLKPSEGIGLPKFIEHLVQEMVRADAQAQTLQHTGWIELQRALKNAAPIDITGGLGELAYLGLREFKLSFAVEPVRPGLWQRLKRVVPYLLGTPGAPAYQVCRLVSGTPQKGSAFLITITVARAEDGSFSVRSEPPPEQWESSGAVYVSDILA